MTKESRQALALVLAATALHLLYAGLLPLSPQEAYYWQYARHPALSYFDHPPLAAWTIALATRLAGATERGVRLAAAVHSVLFCAFFFLAGRRLFGPRAALAALAAALATPLLSLGQVVITPDGPLLAGWMGALYFGLRALDGSGAWLLAAGLAAGAAALGKYTGLLLLPQLLALLLLDARGRRLLRGPWPWLGALLALAVFSPVVAWNAAHGWQSFRFQLADRAAGMVTFRPDRFAGFLGLQAALVSPLLFGLLLAAGVTAARRWRDPSLRAAALWSLPLLGILVAVSPFMWVKGNWGAPVWPTALLAGAALALQDWARWRRPALAAVAVAAGVAAYAHLAPLLPELPFSARSDTTRGWGELSSRVDAERRRLGGEPFVLGCSYKPASELAFYLPDRPQTLSLEALGGPGLAYQAWFDPARLRGKDGVVVLDPRDGRRCPGLEAACARLEPLPPLTVLRGEAQVTRFELWRCRDARAPGRRS
ncbi:glycosyltransferase family 39 protein [Anaeromyxobacter paludicola]|uniref:Glycosyl transferase n=1 Tax=Anaeromyxobacter paludicola TaxID=2918171 RepID=A0ABN6N1I9_9BACT|nr:glycosyltransferase family 39 protein [Anaeromyxobacter paludicola]BDG07046.1 glycosyl transferase [Anaeromyxobacter paludicola]